MANYLTHKKYFGTVEYSAEDEVLFGKIIGINDLVTYEADSASEIDDAFREAVDDYLQTCKELNKAPNKSYKGVFNVRTSVKSHRALAVLAQRKNMKLNEVVKRAINYAIDNEERVLN